MLCMPGEILEQIYVYSIGPAGHNNALVLTCKTIASAMICIRDSAIRRSFRGTHHGNLMAVHVDCINNHLRSAEVVYVCTFNNIYVPFTMTASIQRDKDNDMVRALTIKLHEYGMEFTCKNRRFALVSSASERQVVAFIQKFIPQLYTILAPILTT